MSCLDKYNFKDGFIVDGMNLLYSLSELELNLPAIDHFKLSPEHTC